jgi:hypothetical protein
MSLSFQNPARHRGMPTLGQVRRFAILAPCQLIPSLRPKSRPPCSLGHRGSIWAPALFAKILPPQFENVRVLRTLAEKCESWQRSHNFGARAPNNSRKKLSPDQRDGSRLPNHLNWRRAVN